MTVYQVLCLIGFPSLIVALIGLLGRKLKKNTDDTEAVKSGVQALLRAQMIDDYNKWIDKGYAPIYARENFENVWKWYHAMGKNGVMDDIHQKFKNLPTDPPEEVNNAKL